MQTYYIPGQRCEQELAAVRLDSGSGRMNPIRLLKAIAGITVCVAKNGPGLCLVILKALKYRCPEERRIHAAVYGKECNILIVIAYDSRAVQHRNVGIIFGVILRRIHNTVQHRAASVNRSMQIRIEDRLTESAAVFGGHDRRDDIDKLRKAGNLHTVRMTQKSDQHGTDQNGILYIVDILQLMRSDAPGLDQLVLLLGVIPYVLLIKAQIDRLFTLGLSLDIVAD